VEGLPAELAPVVGKLNALLARLESSFAREREFTADASHELRNPIAALKGILEVTSMRERAPAEYRAALADALVVTGQMTGLVETLLLLARLDGPAAQTEPQLVAVRGLIDDALAPLSAALAERKLLVRVEVPDGTTISTDVARLRLVAQNLIGNAVEHTAQGGQISISSDPQKGLWLEVADSGPQIPAEALPRIFERFFRADSARSGDGTHHGLGLAVVRGVCGSLGTRVTAENRANGWVAFTVTKQ
jgi:signal transduction histidine kinase